MSETGEKKGWKVFIVSHTHWDREWYLPFQKFRMRLVKLMDKLLNILRQDPGFAYFMLDGQTIILEDYLEVKPGRRAELEKHIKEGRILIGPWYVLPDEFLEGPEAIIRNLMLGHRKAMNFGAVMEIGYLPDMFGHIGQMPQILKGFGIDYAVVWRGTPLDIEKTEFYWEAPDGSKVLTAYLRHGYCFGANLPTSFEKFRQRIRNAVNMLSPYASTRNLLLMNGCDHLDPQPELPRLIKRFNEESKDIELVHGTLPAYFKALKESAPQLDSYTGELRAYGRAYLLPNVLSTRIWIKQWNHRCEQVLASLVEPLIAWSWFINPDSPENRERARRLSSLCWLAWKYLLQNHPHDSICGCSVDSVHRDMKNRFKAVEEISEELIKEAAETIAKNVKTKDLPVSLDDAHVILVFNPDYGPRTDYVRATLEFAEKPKGIRVIDGSGKVSPGQIVSVDEKELYQIVFRRNECSRSTLSIIRSILPMIEAGRIMGQVLKGGEVQVKDGTAYVKLTVADRGKPNVEAARKLVNKLRQLIEQPKIKTFKVRVVKLLVDIVFVADEVPAYGYKTFLVESNENEPAKSSERDCSIENEFFRVKIDPKLGLVDIYDKEANVLFKGCNRFIDDGDAGDEYNYSPPNINRLISKPDQPPKIAVVEKGPIRSVIRVDMTYKLPIGLNKDRISRRDELRDFPISVYIALYKGVRRVEFRTVVNNTVEDHRLKVIFPTGVKTDWIYAEGHFDVVRRQVGIPYMRVETDEEPLGTYPHRSFIDVSDGRCGLMISDRGLPEYEAMPGEDGVKVALTLLRSVGWLSQMNLKTRKHPAGPLVRTPEAQCKGKHVFEYALIPHEGYWSQAYKEAHYFINKLWTFETDIHDGILPLSHSWVEVEPSSLIVSAVKIAENGKGIIIRVYNISSEDVEGRIKLYKAFSKAYLTDLNENPLEELKPDQDGLLRLKVAGKKIVTMRLDP